MMLFSSYKRRGFWTSFFVGLGGAVIGGTVAALLTPSTGRELRGRLRRTFSRMNGEEESVDSQLDRMSSEGGAMNAVSPVERSRT